MRYKFYKKHSLSGLAWRCPRADRGLSRSTSVLRTTGVQNFIQLGRDLAVQGPKTCFGVKTRAKPMLGRQ